MIDPVQSALKAVAVGGIFMIWYNFTIEAFKFSWHIISISPEKDTYEAVFKISCENCRKLYDDDECHLCEASR